MSFLSRIGIGHQRPDQDVVAALVDDVVDCAMESHHEARVAIRQGNGKVINMVQEAILGERGPAPKKKSAAG